MSSEQDIFKSGLAVLGQLSTNPSGEIVAEGARATIDDYLRSPRLLSGEGRREQIELLQALREKVGLPAFELESESAPGSDILDFDFDNLTIFNSLGVVVHKFGGNLVKRKRLPVYKSAATTAIEQTFAIARHLSQTEKWIPVTDMYDYVGKELDQPSRFNNRFTVVKKVLGGRIAITDSVPRNVMTVEPFSVRDITI